MERLEKETFYALRVYDEAGNILDKTDGPGDSGDWQYRDSCPMETAIFAIDPMEIKIENEELDIYRAERLLLDEAYNETDQIEKAVCIVGFGIEEAKAFAKENHLDFFYWLFWEGPRQILIQPVNEDDEIVFYSYHD